MLFLQMASHNLLLIAATAMAVVMGALLSTTASAEPNSHLVGGNDGWNLGVDYNNWARLNDGVDAGDTLEFVYLEADHNVVMMEDKASYDACVVPNIAQTWNTGHDIVQLPYPGKFYFICSNHCSVGMKFAITALSPLDR